MKKPNYKSIKFISLLFIIVIFLIFGVAYYIYKKDSIYESNKLTEVTQGVKGTILLRSGGCMPMIGQNGNEACSVLPNNVSTKVIIRKLNNNSKLSKGEIVKKVKGVKSNFQIELPVGSYSLFVLQDGKEYCDRFDEKGRDCFFEVKPNQVSKYDMTINNATD